MILKKNKNMKIQDLTEKDVVHCDTEEKAIKLLTRADKLGLKWSNGKSYLGDTKWSDYKEDTCYELKNGIFCGLGFYRKNDYNIIPFEKINLEELPEKWYLLLDDLSEEELEEVNNWRKQQPNCSYLNHDLTKYFILLSKHPFDDSYYYQNTVSHLLKKDPEYQPITLKEFKEIKKEKEQSLFILKVTDAFKIINAACDNWKLKLISTWGKELEKNETLEIRESFYQEMINASDASQKKLLYSIFGNTFKVEVDLTKPKTYNELKLFEEKGINSTSLIAVRGSGEYENKSFYLNDLFEWEIKKDEYNSICLIPTKK